MIKKEEFINLVEDLKNLTNEWKDEELQKEKRTEAKFLQFCENLNPLFVAEQKRINEKYIQPFVKDNSFLKDKSLLEVIEKHDWETFHSLILKYIWENPKYLQSFISKIKDIPAKRNIISLIAEDDYSVQEEHSTTNNKRIDLLISDNLGRWLIVIENKINSEVRNNQLKNYSRYLDTNKNFEAYTYKVYILLSFRDNHKYITENNDWLYVDYYKVFSSILENKPTDPIIIDYLKTLYLLIFENRHIGEDIMFSLYTARKFYTEVQSKIN